MHRYTVLFCCVAEDNGDGDYLSDSNDEAGGDDAADHHDHSGLDNFSDC